MSELKEVIEKINKYLVEKGYRDDYPDLTESKIKLFDDYREAILDYNEKVNITRIVERDDFERRHYIDSLMCCISDELPQQCFGFNGGVCWQRTTGYGLQGGIARPGGHQPACQDGAS